MEAKGYHAILDVWLDRKKGFELLNSTDSVAALLEGMAKAGEATILEGNYHLFKPQGVSGMLLLAESHVSIHTWPEDGFASIDIFLCSSSDDVQRAIDYCISFYQNKILSHKIQILPRGADAKK